MWYRKTVPALALLGLGAFTLAGAQETDGVAVPGTYRLVAVAGQPLPVMIEEEGDCQEELLAATLEMGQDGAWALTTQEREICGDRVEEDNDTEEGTYTLTGQEVTFVDEEADEEEDDEQEVDVDDLATGTVEANTLTVRLDDGQTVLTFQM